MEKKTLSTSQIGHFKIELLASDEYFSLLSVDPIHVEQKGTAYNGHFGCSCYYPLFVFNPFGDLERCCLRPRKGQSAKELPSVADFT